MHLDHLLDLLVAVLMALPVEQQRRVAPPIVGLAHLAVRAEGGERLEAVLRDEARLRVRRRVLAIRVVIIVMNEYLN